MNKINSTILLTILDGFGLDKPNFFNAISLANMKHFEYLAKTYPTFKLHASGKWVGLPDGQMGNSEVGHLHIGAGRILYQSLSLINNSIIDGSFHKNKSFLNAINYAKKQNSSLHLIGLLSDGGVHSHINHLLELLKLAKQQDFSKVYLHMFLDGRDTKKDVAKIYLKELFSLMNELKVGVLASISGRFYAMDRDKRWDRLEKAYNVIVKNEGVSFQDVFNYIDNEYNEGRNDEFIIPAYNANITNANIKDNDSVIFFNFRPDRAIQLAASLTNANYEFKTNFKPKNLYFVSMTLYSEDVKATSIAFKNLDISNGLGEWISKQGLKQLRIAETEKYAHVTYFFDGGRDILFENSDRILIPSPSVKTYDLKPAMSAYEITKTVIEKINSKKYDLIVLNFANPDMVGHTGNLNATIEALKVIDDCLKQIYEPLKTNNGIMFLTADHGNAEIMIDENGDINKKHTSQPVPLIITKNSLHFNNIKDKSLSNIAPTICDLLDIKIPTEMNSLSLIKK